MTTRSMIITILIYFAEGQVLHCPTGQRYDVTEFPPRCLDCPTIVSNKMALAQIPTKVLFRQSSLKFSPGLPQNETCGCWQAAPNQTANVELNSSAWVVSGFVFNSDRARWLREISVLASNDNVTFIEWGSYTSANFTDAALVLLDLPIRARFFRIVVLRYANHYINVSTGFLLSVQALVSQTQPFTCNCPLLSNGSCCPYMNMSVVNDECRWCMDPTQISTVVINGCGMCRKGTFQFDGRCYSQLPINTVNNLQLATPLSDGVFWTAQLNLSLDARTAVLLFITNRTNFTHPCLANQTVACVRASAAQTRSYIPILTPRATLLPHIARADSLISSRYLQFDRGRYVLNMTEQTIRSWALCSDDDCRGYLGALFITLFPLAVVKVQSLTVPLHFEMGVPNFVCFGGGTPFLALARLELHLFYSSLGEPLVWMVRVVGARFVGDRVYIRWDRSPAVAYNNSEFIPIDTPPDDWSEMRLSNWLNSTVLEMRAPVAVVVHGQLDYVQYSGIAVQVQYGLGFSEHPVPGDSEQVVFITARSPQPVRLKSLSSSTLGQSPITYTNAKGFIIAPSLVLDLFLGCAISTPDALAQWLVAGMQLLPSSPVPNELTLYVQRSCTLIWSGAVARAYWMIPYRPPISSRSQAVQVEIMAEFT